MKFEYSAFDLDQIISLVQKNNITLSFEKIDDFQQLLEEILPIILDVKARSKKYFAPLTTVLKYSCGDGNLKSISNYNSYSDAGIMFDQKNRIDIENISQFLNSYFSLQKTYLFDVSNVFGTVISPDKKHITHSEYSINYLPLKIFTSDELLRFISYIPLLQSSDIDVIQSCNLGITNFVVNADGAPQKIECIISKNDIAKLKIFEEYQSNDKIVELIANSNSSEDCKIGFYFVGEEQNKITLLFSITNKNFISTELKNINLPDDIENILYELCWENGSIIETNVSYLKNSEDGGLTGG